MPIIVGPDPTHTLREQVARLWHRNRAQAVWLALSVLAATVVWLTLTLGLTVAGIYLGERGLDRDSFMLVVAGAVLTLSGVPLGERFRRRAYPVLLRVAAILVREAAQHDPEERATPTTMERRAIVELRDGLADVRQRTQEAMERSDRQCLANARTDWVALRGPPANRLSRCQTPKRLEVVEDLLIAGYAVRP